MKICCFGANSAIAKHIIYEYADSSPEVILVGRDQQKLDVEAQHLKARYSCKTQVFSCDFTNTEKTIEVCKTLKDIDVFIIAHGYLGSQDEAQNNHSELQKIIDVNYTSYAHLLEEVGRIVDMQQFGKTIVIGSVAGDRGRQSNYIYGSSKGAIELYVQGLQHRFAHNPKIHFLLAKPGFVDTPMTKDFPKGPLWAKPKAVAKLLVQGLNKNKRVVYTPKFWFLIMTLIKWCPFFVFKKTKL